MLSKLKIAAKIACIAITISVIGILASFYSARVIRSADDDYSALIENLDKSTVALAGINRMVNAMGYGVYRAIAYNGPESEAAARIALDAIDQAKDDIEAVTTRLTDRKAQIDEIRQDLLAITDDVGKAVGYGTANRDDEALAIMTTVDPKIAALSKKITTIKDETMTRVDDRSNELTEMSFSNSYMLIGGTIVTSLMGLIAALWVSARGITGPLNVLREKMAELASGRLDVDVVGQDRGDEVGAMARAVEIFKQAANQNKRLEEEAAVAESAQAAQRDRQSAIENAKAEDLKAFVHHVEEGFDALSDGNLTVRMAKAVAPEFEPIRAKFNASVEKLERTIGTVAGAVGTMRVGLTEITVAAGDLSQRTEQQAASLEETVAALTEAVRGVNLTAQSADDAKSAAFVAQKEAEKGGAVVAQAVAAMAQIEQSSDKIGKIIGVIDEIAFQTNLLALNAGVEAARAGEAGKGFAVVAQEVRGLAQRSAEAAKEIKDLIATSSTQVAQGVDLVSASGRSLEQIVEQVGGVAHVIVQMAQSAREQSVSLKEVSVAADQMDKVTQQNAAMVEETTAAAQTLLSETQALAGLMEGFRTNSAHKVAATPRKAAKSPSRPVAQMRTTGAGTAAAASRAAPAEDNWTEF